MGCMLPVVAQVNDTGRANGAGQGGQATDNAQNANAGQNANSGRDANSGNANTGQTTDTGQAAGGRGNANSSETRTGANASATFNPEVRTKVLSYFDTHKSHPHGLPPGLAKKFVAEEIPSAWRIGMQPGIEIKEELRTHLVEVPSDLQKFLPETQDNIRYYIAGSNVIAVDSDYSVVDSIQIPSVKYTVE